MINRGGSLARRFKTDTYRSGSMMLHLVVIDGQSQVLAGRRNESSRNRNYINDHSSHRSGSSSFWSIRRSSDSSSSLRLPRGCSSDRSVRVSEGLRGLDWERHDRCVFLRVAGSGAGGGAGGGEEGPCRRLRGRSRRAPALLPFPRGAHYTNGASLIRLSTGRIRSVIPLKRDRRVERSEAATR